MTSGEIDPADRGLEPLVLGLVGFDRTAGDMRFLSGLSDLDVGAIEAALSTLEREGYVRSSTSPRGSTFECTPDGRRWLEAERSDWTFEVLDVFNLSVRPRPLLLGRLLEGDELRSDDHFLVGDRVGRVIGVELVHVRDRPPDEFVIATDLPDVAVGDILRRFEMPFAG